MKLNELISARYNCKFPAILNPCAAQYYLHNSTNTECGFIIEEMMRTKNYELHTDEIRYMCEMSEKIFADLFEAYVYASWEKLLEKGERPKTLIIVLDGENVHTLKTD